MSISRGEVVALLGPDGAGKSVCFEAIAGLVRPDGGRILLDGVDVTALPTYRRARLGLAYLPEGQSIFRGMTVAENIEAVLEVSEPDRAACRSRLERILEDFRLSALRDRSALALSGGERRRCEIARAMAMSPSILLLDEPFAGIDPMSIEDIIHVVGGLRRNGVGVLMADYDLHDMLELMDRAYVLYEGRVIFAGSPAELLADERVRMLYLGSEFDHGRSGQMAAGSAT
jgi:lipopolysaccharide export system ATP-binding protein